MDRSFYSINIRRNKRTMPNWLWESIELTDLLDILLVSFILYQTLLLLRGNPRRAESGGTGLAPCAF